MQYSFYFNFTQPFGTTVPCMLVAHTANWQFGASLFFGSSTEPRGTSSAMRPAILSMVVSGQLSPAFLDSTNSAKLMHFGLGPTVRCPALNSLEVPHMSKEAYSGSRLRPRARLQSSTLSQDGQARLSLVAHMGRQTVRPYCSGFASQKFGLALAAPAEAIRRIPWACCKSKSLNP